MSVFFLMSSGASFKLDQHFRTDLNHSRHSFIFMFSRKVVDNSSLVNGDVISLPSFTHVSNHASIDALSYVWPSLAITGFSNSMYEMGQQNIVTFHEK